MYNGIEYRYQTCPINFIPSSIREFYKIYNYYQEFQSAVMPSYQDVSNRFLLAVGYFKNYLQENVDTKNKIGR